MVEYAATGLLLGGGTYLLLLGMGRLAKPARLKGNDEIAVVGRVLIFLGVLLLPTCFGYSLSDIKGWMQDIWTSGGGVGTG